MTDPVIQAATTEVKTAVTTERKTVRDWMSANPFKWGLICMGVGVVITIAAFVVL